MTVNPGSSNSAAVDISPREYNLQPKINIGGYDVPSSMPMTSRMQNMRDDSYENDKSRMARNIAMQHQGRYLN